jgi:hypothetical protein
MNGMRRVRSRQLSTQRKRECSELIHLDYSCAGRPAPSIHPSNEWKKLCGESGVGMLRRPEGIPAGRLHPFIHPNELIPT